MNSIRYYAKEYPEDCNRIIDVAKKNGWELGKKQAVRLWKGYSEDLAAGWLILPEEDSDLWDILLGELNV